MTLEGEYYHNNDPNGQNQNSVAILMTLEGEYYIVTIHRTGNRL